MGTALGIWNAGSGQNRTVPSLSWSPPGSPVFPAPRRRPGSDNRASSDMRPRRKCHLFEVTLQVNGKNSTRTQGRCFPIQHSLVFSRLAKPTVFSKVCSCPFSTTSFLSWGRGSLPFPGGKQRNHQRKAISLEVSAVWRGGLERPGE